MPRSDLARAGVAALCLWVGCSGSGGPPDGSVDASSHATLDAGPPEPLLPLDQGELRPGGETTTEILDEGAFVQQAANLSILRRGQFEAGLQFFQLEWVPAPGRSETDGLGPTFNATTCVGCHVRNGRGRPPRSSRSSSGILIRLGSERGPDPAYGGQLQPFGIPGVPGEGAAARTLVPSERIGLAEIDVQLHDVHYALSDLAFGPLAPETRLSARVAQQLVGQGLLESIPLEDLIALEDPDDADGDGISGRVAWLADGSAGRFGWKASQPTTMAQTAAAFAEDLGLTSSVHPEENCPPVQEACRAAPHGGQPEIPDVRLRATAAYVRLLGVPARRSGEDVLWGKTLFHQVGCASCHRPSHRTGDALEPELADQHIWPYTDLLLHDMGPGLADGVPEGAATGSEWRTAPLWGLGLVEVVNGARHLLHDGRAATLAEAILWHGGEGGASRDAYVRLSEQERAALHAFLESL